MKLPRGFKSYCEQSVATLREELGLIDDDPVDMHALAEYLLIPVQPLERLVGDAGQSRADPQVDEIYRSVSAFTYFDGPRRFVIYNEEHAPPRHRSNLAHELAHALLLHPPRDAGLGRDQEEAHEAEAAWLSGVLMLTARQARRIATSGMCFITAAARFKVSAQMLRFRINVTGAARLTSSSAL